MTLAAILKNKGPDVFTVTRGATLAEVAAGLAARGVGFAVVLGTGNLLEGVISERDVIRRLAAHGPMAMALPVEQVMTRGVITATPRTTVDQAMALMTAGGFRHLPVMNKGELVGVISIRDVVRAKLDMNETEVECLRAYVACSA